MTAKRGSRSLPRGTLPVRARWGKVTNEPGEHDHVDESSRYRLRYRLRTPSFLIEWRRVSAEPHSAQAPGSRRSRSWAGGRRLARQRLHRSRQPPLAVMGGRDMMQPVGFKGIRPISIPSCGCRTIRFRGLRGGEPPRSRAGNVGAFHRAAGRLDQRTIPIKSMDTGCSRQDGAIGQDVIMRWKPPKCGTRAGRECDGG